MTTDNIHASTDAKSAALIIAKDMFAFAQFNDDGSVPKGTERERHAKIAITLIAAAAKELYAAVSE